MEKPIKAILEDIKKEIKQTAAEESDEQMWSRGLIYAVTIINKYMNKEGIK